jgi:hypothetical protein
MFQCSKTFLKAQEKNDTNVSVDNESAFLSLNSNAQLSTFILDSNEVYLQSDMLDMNDNIHVEFSVRRFPKNSRTTRDQFAKHLLANTCSQNIYNPWLDSKVRELLASSSRTLRTNTYFTYFPIYCQ